MLGKMDTILSQQGMQNNTTTKHLRNRKVMTPKEEQKKHLIDMMRDDEELGLYEEPKQETTLEEAAVKIYPNNEYEDELYCDIGEVYREKFVEGAKWQQERMYSEEEVLDLLVGFTDSRGKDFITFKDIQEWFKQFKKK